MVFLCPLNGEARESNFWLPKRDNFVGEPL